MNTIIYEEKRGLINKVVKQNLNLTISEIIILDKLRYLNKRKMNALDLKNNYKFKTHLSLCKSTIS